MGLKQTSQIVGLSLRERLFARLRAVEGIPEYLGVMALTGLLSGSTLFSQLAPFGVAAVGAFSGDYTFAAMLGAVIGYLLAPSLDYRMKYIAAAVIVGVVRWAFLSPERRGRFSLPSKITPLLAPPLAALALALCGGLTLWPAQNITYSLILLLCECLLAGGGCLFFSRAALVLDPKDRRPIRRHDLSAVIISFGILVVSLCSFTMFSLSLGRIVAAVAVLIAADRWGESGGAAAGVTAGAAICLSDYSLAFLMGSFGFGGLMAGVFAGVGRFPSAAAMLLCNAFSCALAALVTPVSLTPVWELTIACVVFVLIPQRLLSKLSVVISGECSMAAESLRDLMLTRLQVTTRSLSDVSDITARVSDKLMKLTPPQSDIAEALSQRLCRACSHRLTCWGSTYNDTASVVNDLCSRLRRSETLTPSQLPEPLLVRCPDVRGFLGMVQELYGRHKRQEAQFMRSVQMRRAVMDQWSGIHALIDGITGDISGATMASDELCLRISSYFKRQGIKTDRESAYMDQNGRLIVEIWMDKLAGKLLERKELCIDLSELCEREFALPEPVCEGQSLCLRFSERPFYHLEQGICQIAAAGKRVCGDSVRLLPEVAGGAVAILSDGMGCGSLAAVDSSMTVSLLARLLSAGVTPEAALRLTNAAMLIKSSDESLATVDICEIDRYTGRVTLYKAGAAPSFVKKEGRVGYILSSSLPAGIVGSIEFETTAITLGGGDTVLLCSDGVCSGGEEWLLDELERQNGSDMQLLAERIASLAKMRAPKEHGDDITVCALQLVESGS